MTNKISTSDVLKVAQLARLDIPEDQIGSYTDQLEKILGYVAQLEEIDTQGVSPTTRAVEVVNVHRNDEVIQSSLKEALLSLAPEREEDFFKVPKILDS